MPCRITAIIILFSGCQGSNLQTLLRRHNFGEPLRHFQASNGQYFPKEVKSFFQTGELFEKKYPTLDLAKSQIKLIDVKPISTANSPYNESNLSWSADGLYLSYEVEGQGSRKIFLKNLTGSFNKELFVIPKSKWGGYPAYLNKYSSSFNSGLSWSHDSTRYAFMSNGGIGTYNIFVGAVGKKEVPIASSRSKDGFAKWNPNSSHIVFTSGRTGNGDLYLMNLDSRELQKITDTTTTELFPEWSPDGMAVVYCSGTNINHDIKIIRFDKHLTQKQSPQFLTASSIDSIRPTVSPNNKFVAFYGNDKKWSSKWNIYVVPLSRTSLSTEYLQKSIVAENVVVDLETGPTWSPDSKKLFFVRNDPANFNPIFAYDLLIGKLYQIETNTKLNSNLMISKLGILSFKSQIGAWNKVFVALTNQGLQIQGKSLIYSKINYLNQRKEFSL